MTSEAPQPGQTVVTFNSTAFNHTERKPYFINDCCFGDDLLKWMITELTQQGVKTIGEPEQEDFGWYLTFEVAGTQYFFLTSYRPDDFATGATWIGFIERVASPLARLLRREKHGVDPAAPEAIHRAISSSAQIHDIRWYKDGDSY
jgi:hypothetical protein